MTPSRSAPDIPSLVRALLPVRLVRQVVVTILALAIGLALWVVMSDQIAGGIVVQTYPEHAESPQFVTLSAAPGARAVRLPEGGAVSVALNDAVLASGIPRDTGRGAFLAAEVVTVLPLARLRAEAAALQARIPLADLHPAGLMLASLLVVLLAPAVLRLTFAGVMAVVTGCAIFVLWHLNTSMVVIPLPDDILVPVLFGALLAGLVAGWTAMSATGGSSIRMLGQRAAALLLVGPVNQALAPVAGVSEPVLLGLLLVAAMLRPTLVPAALALPLTQAVFDLPPLALAGVALKVVIFRLWQDYKWPIASERVPDMANPTSFTPPPFAPRPDARGSFDLDQILELRKEG